MIRLLLLILSICLMSAQAWAADDWYWKGSGQVLVKSYSGSTQLNGLSGFAVYLASDYLEQSGFTVGYSANNTDYKSGLSGAPLDIDEDIFFLSGRRNYNLDQLPGRLTLRVDAYIGSDKMHYRTTGGGSPMGGGSARTITVEDEFRVLNPIVSFLNYRKTFYIDLGYARSSYRSDDNGVEDIDISQWAPTLGFGFDRAYNWVQVRAYLISLSNSNRVADKDGTSALEVKYTHWFTADAPLNLHNLRLSILSGERIYAVDSDACSLCNVPDLQTGAVSIGAEWKINEQLSVQLQGAYETYENLLIDDEYSSNNIFVYVSQSW